MSINRKKPKFNFLFSIGLIIIVMVFSFAMYVQAAEYFELKQQLKQTQQEQQTVVEENQELANEIAYQDSDEYIEKVAREQLNLVKPNEIVFVDENK